MQMFKTLSESEVIEYKAWARENYKALEPISGLWHPIVQSECTLINDEYSQSLAPLDAMTAMSQILGGRD